MKRAKGAMGKLDVVFSEFIRRRDADIHGFVTCVSCKNRIPWKESNCCHYANRQHMATRWDEINCHAGCYTCNCFNKGFHIHEYGKFLNLMYGSGTSDEIIQKSKTTVHITEHDMLEKILYYKSKIREYEKT